MIDIFSLHSTFFSTSSHLSELLWFSCYLYEFQYALTGQLIENGRELKSWSFFGRQAGIVQMFLHGD